MAKRSKPERRLRKYVAEGLPELRDRLTDQVIKARRAKRSKQRINQKRPLAG